MTFWVILHIPWAAKFNQEISIISFNSKSWESFPTSLHKVIRDHIQDLRRVDGQYNGGRLPKYHVLWADNHSPSIHTWDKYREQVKGGALRSEGPLGP